MRTFQEIGFKQTNKNPPRNIWPQVLDTLLQSWPVLELSGVCKDPVLHPCVLTLTSRFLLVTADRLLSSGG